MTTLPSGRYSLFLSRIRPVFLVLGIALFLRLGWLYQFNPVPRRDFLDVHIEAVFYSTSRSSPRNYQAPGYSVLVSFFYRLFGSNYRIVHYLNACLGTLSCFLIFLLGKELFDHRIGLAAGLLGAVHPEFVGLCTLLAYENLLIPLLIAGVFFLIKERSQNKIVDFIPAGILWASAALVRPTIFLFPLYLSAVCFRKYRRERFYYKIVGISLITILCMTAWVGKDLRTTRYSKLTRQAGIALWMGNNPTHYLGTGSRPRNLSTSIFLNWQDRRYLKMALREIADHPIQFLSKAMIKIENLFIAKSNFLSFTVEENYSGIIYRKRYKDQAFYLSPFFRWFAYFIIGGFIVFAVDSLTWKPPLGFLFHLIVYWVIIHAVFFAQPRFRLSIDPFLIVATAVILIRLWDRFVLKYSNRCSRGMKVFSK